MKTDKRPVPCKAYQVRPGIWRFQDDTGASFYLIDGSGTAVVIDTGLSEGELLPVLRQYTQKPLALLITHGHGDHMAHADEFETVYMAAEDIPYVEEASRRLGLGSDLRPERFIPLRDGQTLKFDDIELTVYLTPGHSVGSAVFYDRAHGLVFSGDAFGSGWAVFMQLPGGSSVSEYRDGMRKFLEAFQGVEPEPEFLPGHYDQRYHDDNDNPVCLALVSDMAELCGRLLDGTADMQPVNIYPHAQGQEYMAAYGRAQMVVTKEKVR